MSVGKACAQVAHAAQMFINGYMVMKTGENAPHSRYTKLIENTAKWMGGSFRKVVLGGTAKDFEKIKAELQVFVVRDAGLTEIEPGTETVIVTWPIPKSEQPKVLARLQVLKDLKKGNE
jgi:PTH2 family peptidyl-tRNA hydrolase